MFGLGVGPARAVATVRRSKPRMRRRPTGAVRVALTSVSEQERYSNRPGYPC
ncbi:MAG: hypothetical protein OXI96_09880 [Acidimicrobiaceae bacterium]|nr:hypothetical protein [Acidimicrobiaceae bacterium]